MKLYIYVFLLLLICCKNPKGVTVESINTNTSNIEVISDSIKTNSFIYIPEKICNTCFYELIASLLEINKDGKYQFVVHSNINLLLVNEITLILPNSKIDLTDCELVIDQINSPALITISKNSILCPISNEIIQ